MRKTISFMITIVLLLCSVGSIHVMADSQPDYSDGYYQITSASDLEWFGNYVMNDNNGQSANAKLCNNINIHSLWDSCVIGSNSRAFKGIFDGQGYTISGLNVASQANGDGVGLFGLLEGSAVVKNFTLTGEITDGSTKPSCIGAVACRGQNGAQISNVTVNVNITENDDTSYVGGIVGSSQSAGNLTIEKCFYNGTINVPAANDCIGGIIGYANERVSIRNCGSEGTINSGGTNAKVGGILGYINNASFGGLSGCYSDMILSTSTSSTVYKGGIIGRVNSAGAGSVNNIRNNVCGINWPAYGGEKGSTYTASQVSSWPNSQVSQILNNGLMTADSTWVQSKSINGGRPVLRSSLPECDLVISYVDMDVVPDFDFASDNHGNTKLVIKNYGNYELSMRSGVPTTRDCVVIESPYLVMLTLNNIAIDRADMPSDVPDAPLCISEDSSVVTVTLKGTNILTGSSGRAGLQKDNTADLSITTDETDESGAGSLTATGGEDAAGIGGGANQDGTNIRIYSGTIIATGSEGGTGIGGGYGGAGIGIRISGGVVTAASVKSQLYSAGEGAGIGSGKNGTGSSITISGGAVNAKSKRGAGIGAGYNGSGENTFSTGENGSACITTGSISDRSYKSNPSTGGIIVIGRDCVVYGNQTLSTPIPFNEQGAYDNMQPRLLSFYVPYGASLALDKNVDVNVDYNVTKGRVDGEVIGIHPEVYSCLSYGNGKINDKPPLHECNVFADISASLTQDISLTYYISQGGYTEAPPMRFTSDTYSVVVAGSDTGEGLFVYQLTGIAPQWMGDDIRADVLDKDGGAVATKLYSVKQYLDVLKAKTKEQLGYSQEQHDALHTLIDDLLVYGGAAQSYAGYKTEALVSAGVTGSEFSLEETDLHLENNGAYAAFTGATVNFNSINRMKIYFTAEDAEGLVIKYRIGEGEEQEIEYASDGSGGYFITTPGIYASDFSKAYTFTAYKGDEAGATLIYSIKSYVYAMQTSENGTMADLAKATYNYGVAAKAFVEAMQVA